MTTYGGPGFPYRRFSDANYEIAKWAHDNNVAIEEIPAAIFEKYHAPFAQWKINENDH